MKPLTLPLTVEQEALLPSEADVAFYEAHGWYISPKVIPDEVLDAALAGSDRFYQGDKDASLPIRSGYSNWTPDDGNTIRNNEFVSLQQQELQQLALQPVIGAIAARLARTSEIRLLDDQLVYKPPQIETPETTIVGWHADRAYWATCSSHQLLTAWIPFHDCDEARGPLVVLDGSHRWQGMQDARFFNHQNLERIEDQFRQQGYPIVRVPMTLNKGQVSFHHCWTIHGSYPNRSAAVRLAMAVHLQDRANRYQPFTNAEGKSIHIFDEQLCRTLPTGEPDFADPAVFPVLWAEHQYPSI
jgi:ectoine hydroxylase-related dioxygenase (phytanoyl-CoA dioxygenase family)